MLAHPAEWEAGSKAVHMYSTRHHHGEQQCCCRGIMLSATVSWRRQHQAGYLFANTCSTLVLQDLIKPGAAGWGVQQLQSDS